MGSKRLGLKSTCAAIAFLALPAQGECQVANGSTPSDAGAPADGGTANGSPTQTNSNGANRIEEVIVTARRRSESLLSVPVSVTAISAASLEQANATNLEGIATLVPQLVISRSTGGAGGSITLRGLGTAGGDASLDQSVSVNVDGVQVNRGTIISQGFFDLGQVEVLKGPQALFFGKNSPAGVISLTSANPTDKLAGYVRGGYEFDAGQRFGEAAIGGGLTDTIKARIAFRASRMDGFVRNTAVPMTTNPFYPGLITTAGPPRNGGEELVGRLTLVYEPSSSFDATLKAAGSTYKDNGVVTQAYCPGGAVPLVTPNGFTKVPDPNGDCALDGRFTNPAIPQQVAATIPGARDGNPYTLSRLGLLSLTMNYRFSGLTLTSITGLLGLNEEGGNTFSNSSYALFYSHRHEKTRTISQEVRLVSDYSGPINFTIGGFFEDNHRNYNLDSALTGSLIRDPATGKYESYENFNTNQGNTYSGFGQLRLALAKTLELAGGARYTREVKDVMAVNTYVNPFTVALLGSRAQGNPLLVPVRDSNWSPEATLSWKPQADTLIYAAYKTGFKSGGAANPSRLSTFQTEAQTRYRPETSSGGEIGAKTYLAGHTVRIEATAYDYLYKDLQVSVFDASVQPSGASYITNAAAARVKGVELTGEWYAARGLRLNEAATYNDARYRSFPTAVCYLGQTAVQGCVNGSQNLAGFPLTRAPKWAFSSGGSYDLTLTPDVQLGFSAGANYSSRYYTEEDYAPGTAQDGFWLFDAGLRLHNDRGGWEISFNARNLTDRYYLKACTARFLPGQFSCENVRARQLTVQAGLRF